MAYTEEKFFERGTKFGKTWRISILEDGGAGAGDRITAKDEFFTKRYPTSEPREFWKRRILEPILEVTIRFDPDTDLSFYKGIAQAPDDTYRIRFQYGGSTDVIGSIKGGIVTINERAAPKTVTLRAKPLTVQKANDFPLAVSKGGTPYLSVIGDIINQTGFDLPIYTYNDWEAAELANSTDYLWEAAIDDYHFRDYAGNRSEDTPFTYYEALESVIPDSFILFMADGAWHLMNVPYIAKQEGANVQRYGYTWDGSAYQQSTDEVVNIRGVVDGLVGLWRFDGDVKDSAGTNDGTVNGTTTFVAGTSEQALELATDDFFEIKPNDIGLDLQNETVACWISGYTDRSGVGGGSVDERLITFGSYNGTNSVTFGIQNGNLSIYVNGQVQDTWTFSGNLDSEANTIYDEGPFHVAFRFVDDDTIEIYMNAKLMLTADLGSNGFSGYSDNQIQFLDGINGYVDEIRTYNRLLPKQEIKDLYKYPGQSLSFGGGNYLLRHASDSDYHEGIKSLVQEYNHKTLIQSMSLDASYTHTTAEETSTESTSFTDEDIQKVIISGDVTMQIEESGGTAEGTAEYYIKIGDWYWDDSTSAWVDSPGVIPLIEVDVFGPADDGLTNTTYQLETDAIPDLASGDIEVQFQWGTAQREDGTTLTVDQIEWIGWGLDIVTTNAISNGASIEYKLTQSQSYSLELSLPDRIFGQGPTEYSEGRIRDNVDGTALANWGPSGQDYSRFVMSQIMSTQRNGIRVVNAELWTEFNIGDVVEYEGEYFLILGGDFNGKDQKWQCYLYKLDYNTASDTLSEVFIGGGQSTTGTSGGSGAGLSQENADARYLRQTENLAELTSVEDAQDNLGLTNQTADLDLNSLAIGGDNILDLFYEQGEIDSFFGLYLSEADLQSGNEDLDLKSIESDTGLFTGLLTARGGIQLEGSSIDWERGSDVAAINYVNDGSTGNHLQIYTADDGSEDYVEILNNHFDEGDKTVAEFKRTKINFFDDTSIHGAVDASRLDVQVNGSVDLISRKNNSASGQPGRDLNFYTGSSESLTATFGADKIVSFQDDLRMMAGDIETDHFSDWFSVNPTGFQVTYQGVGDFRTLYIDELIAKAFTADVAQALAGSDFLTKSVAKVAEDFTVPAVGNTVTIKVEDLEGLSDLQTFEVGDWIRFRVVSRSGGGLAILDVYGTVSNYVDNADDTQSWTYTVDYAGASDAAVGMDIYKGAVALDYGVSGDTFIERTVLDRSSGSDFSKVPYDRIVRWTNSGSGGPRTSAAGYSAEVLTQRGNINGLGSFSTETYGVFAKDNFYVELDNGSMNLGKDVGPSDQDGIHVDSNDYWYSDGTGSMGDGVLTWDRDISQVTFAGWLATSNKIAKDNLQLISDNSGFTGLFDGTPAGVATVSAVNTPTDFNDRIYAHLRETYSAGWTGRFGFSLGQSKIKDAVFEVAADMSTGALEAQIAGWNFDRTDLWSGGDGTKNDASVRFDSANGRIYYDAMGHLAYSYTEKAGFNNDDTAFASPNEYYQTLTTSSQDSKTVTKQIERVYFPYGIEKVVVIGRARQDNTGSANFFTYVRAIVPGVNNDRVEISSTSSTEYQIILDVTGISIGVHDVRIQAQIEIDGATSNQTAELWIDEDLIIFPTTSKNV